SRSDAKTQSFLNSLVRPIKLLIFSPMVLLPSLLLGFIFGVFYLLLSTIAMAFQVRYHFSQLSSSLAYLGLGVGMFFGLAFFGYLHEKIPKYFKSRNSPEIQLLPMMIGAPLASIGLLIYGWA